MEADNEKELVYSVTAVEDIPGILSIIDKLTGEIVETINYN